MRVLLDPRPALERNGGQRTIDCGPITSKAAWLFGLLRKVDLPGTTVLPLSQSFAAHVIVVAVVRMKNQHRRGKTCSGDRVWKHTQIRSPIPIFLDAEITRAHLRNGNHIIEGALFFACCQSPLIHDLVIEMFRCRDTVNALHKLANVICGAVENLPQRAGNAGLHPRQEFIDVRGNPLG